MNPAFLDTACESLLQIAPSATYSPGYDPDHSDANQALIDDAVAAAIEADVAIIFAGLPGIFESEGFDRTHMDLPAQHNALISAVCEVADRVVVVLSNGAPVAMPWVAEPQSIVEGYLGGQASGSAIVDVLFGAVNPSGKLAETFPLQVTDTPSDAWFPGAPRQVQYREGLMVGYRHFAAKTCPVLLSVVP